MNTVCNNEGEGKKSIQTIENFTSLKQKISAKLCAGKKAFQLHFHNENSTKVNLARIGLLDLNAWNNDNIRDMQMWKPECISVHLALSRRKSVISVHVSQVFRPDVLSGKQRGWFSKTHLWRCSFSISHGCRPTARVPWNTGWMGCRGAWHAWTMRQVSVTVRTTSCGPTRKVILLGTCSRKTGCFFSVS